MANMDENRLFEKCNELRTKIRTMMLLNADMNKRLDRYTLQNTTCEYRPPSRKNVVIYPPPLPSCLPPCPTVDIQPPCPKISRCVGLSQTAKLIYPLPPRPCLRAPCAPVKREPEYPPCLPKTPCSPHICYPQPIPTRAKFKQCKPCLKVSLCEGIVLKTTDSALDKDHDKDKDKDKDKGKDKDKDKDKDKNKDKAVVEEKIEEKKTNKLDAAFNKDGGQYFGQGQDYGKGGDGKGGDGKGADGKGADGKGADGKGGDRKGGKGKKNKRTKRTKGKNGKGDKGLKKNKDGGTNGDKGNKDKGRNKFNDNDNNRNNMNNKGDRNGMGNKLGGKNGNSGKDGKNDNNDKDKNSGGMDIPQLKEICRPPSPPCDLCLPPCLPDNALPICDCGSPPSCPDISYGFQSDSFLPYLQNINNVTDNCDNDCDNCCYQLPCYLSRYSL